MMGEDKIMYCSDCGTRYKQSERHACKCLVQGSRVERDPLLQEREKTHGDFSLNAQISQALKSTFRAYAPLKDGDMVKVHREALDMIALKLSRILSGQANFRDHWRDLSGYSLLAMEACDDDKKV